MSWRRGAAVAFAALSLLAASACDQNPGTAGPPKTVGQGPGHIHPPARETPDSSTTSEVTTTTAGQEAGTTTTAAPGSSTTRPATTTGPTTTKPTTTTGSSSTTGAPSTTGGTTTTAPSVPPLTGKALFYESFGGSPSSPLPWRPENWDVTVHSRDVDTLYQLESMNAAHGMDCGAPPATHTMSTYEDAVFLCKDHVMTSINAGGYGAVYLTPGAMVDFSDQQAVIRFDVSTSRTSRRDWIDLWLTPFDDTLQFPLESFYPDLNGPPKQAIHIVMDNFDDGHGQGSGFRAEVYNNFDASRLPNDYGGTYEQVFTPSATRRDTFEVRIAKDHLVFGMPAYNIWWIDTSMPALNWTQGVVQLGHHSYNPTKDCAGCGPNTWHWDNVSISPSKPFTMIHADRRYADGNNSTITLNSPAPSGANLRFSGLGKNLEVSFDGGKTWAKAALQAMYQTAPEEHATSYWTPIPPGTTSVKFRGQDWFAGPWLVRDPSVFAR